jgi:hypothetical protein
LFFERERNWTGLLVEANPGLFKKIVELNRKAYSVNACLSTTNKTEKLLFRPAYLLGGLVESMDSAHAHRVKVKHGNSTPDICVQCFTLHSILRALSVSHIDYFSLDVEGPELEILKTIPFDKIKIDIFTVEYKIMDHKQTMVEKSREKLRNIQKFFAMMGNYKQVGILPDSSGQTEESKMRGGLDVIFQRVS